MVISMLTYVSRGLYNISRYILAKALNFGCQSLKGSENIQLLSEERLHSQPQFLRVWERACKLWETLRRRSQNLAIWASKRMLFSPTKPFRFFYMFFIAKDLCSYGIRRI